jgi:hypothetical protein
MAISRTNHPSIPIAAARYRSPDGTHGAKPVWSANSPVLQGYSGSGLRSERAPRGWLKQPPFSRAER